MKILLVADDLTGALDSSVAFSERGLKVLCGLSPEHADAVFAETCDVAVISTNSRELSEIQALAKLDLVLDTARRHPDWSGAILFKKVDSRLKGHVAAEVSRLAEIGKAMIICPAIPRLGRLVKNGAVCGAGVSVPIMVSEKTGRPASEIPDATEQHDLDRALPARLDSSVFVGAAGLAEALARRVAPQGSRGADVPLPAPALFAIGSRDPVTMAQMSGLKGRAITEAPNGALPAAITVDPTLQILQMTAGESALPPELAGARFAEAVAALVQKTAPATLMACGGETAAAITRLANCGRLEVLGEALPGLPVSRMLDGCSGLTLVTKSGGFGTPETLVKLVEKLVTSQLETA